MKKIIALLLSLVMIFSFAACGGEKDNGKDKDDNDKVTTEQQEDAQDKEDKDEEADKDDGETGKPASKPSSPSNTQKPSKPSGNNSGKPAVQDQSAGKQLAGIFKNELSKDPSKGALAIAEAISGSGKIPYAIISENVVPGLLTGFGNTEISGFKDGAIFSPVIGSTPFIGYVFILDNGTDVNSFVKTLSANADRRWNICTEAEETTIETKGNAVFFVMCNRSLDE